MPPSVVSTPAANPPLYGSWQQALKDAVRDPRELCRLLDLPPEFESAAMASSGSFPVFAPRGYIARMRRGDVHDPLLRQVLPLAEEQVAVPGFTADPVDDRSALLSPGLLHKYQGRVLMVATGACAVHCRYCFRREYPYSDSPRSLDDWSPALQQISDDSSIHEVILSGGDPLTIVDAQLERLIRQLAQISHLRRIRIHTRLPVVLPERVTFELIDLLRATRLTPLVVIHANHPAEFDASAARAIGQLVDAGIPLLNQTVLLRGVNDDEETLVELSERLVDLRVMPYYLHQLDRVRGAAHFEVPISVGLDLVERLRARLPGYAVPRYVQELPGEPSKLPL